MKKYLLILCAAFIATGSLQLHSKELKPKQVDFVAFQPAADFQLPSITLQYDPSTKAGANWEDLKNPKWSDTGEAIMLVRATIYLKDGLKRMTGKDFPVVSSNDLSKGIVLTLLKNASEDIRKDPEVQKALAENPKDPYAAKEAFFFRSEKNRLLVVANTAEGLTDAVSDLLETVNYEVLGMGVDWINAPDHRTKPLVFRGKHAGRPSFYIRNLWAHSGQSFGYGTILDGLQDPDESVVTSCYRWVIGTRMLGSSMPVFPGHALQTYHTAILDKMRELHSPEGFLSHTGVGPESERPAVKPELKDTSWLNTDPKGTPGFGKIYYCDGVEWKELFHFGGVDVSAPLARDVIFAAMKKESEAAFTSNPNDPYMFPMDAEDGETITEDRDKYTSHRNWYPEYLEKEKLPWGRPYVLNGFKGLNQPKETWEPASASDNLYAFANYLLHEYDKWIDSLPKEQQVTSSGKSKKALIRSSMQSYNYHDVPPNFNLDPRVRSGVAPFPKNRGIGKWENIVTQEDMSRALQIMIPEQASSNYSFYSFSFYADGGAGGIPAVWDASPKAIADIYHRYYEVGFRAISYEMDYNFGKYGLGYYLASKMLWNVNLSVKDLDAIRDRWMQRSFGSAWKEMKAYYDFLLPKNYPVNTPNAWGKATRLLDAADKKLTTLHEPEAQRRVDDVKQYWYVHYLFDSGKFTKDAPEVKEFLWKNQMSYMVGMQGLLGREYKSSDVRSIVGPQISAGPAHYTHDETQVWWPKVLDFWKVKPVTLFSDATLANGKPAKTIDLNDLVMVKEFQMNPTDSPFYYNSAYMKYGTFLMSATQKDALLGFKLMWPFRPDEGYLAKKVYYSVDIWDPVKKVWTQWLDKTMTYQQSEELTVQKGKWQVANIQIKAPHSGTYRFTLGTGGNLSSLCNPTYDPVTNHYSEPIGFTFYTDAEGLTQSEVYVYIPKGTKSLDLDVWDLGKDKTLVLYTGLPSSGLKESRKVDIGAIGTYTILLQPGEDGSFASFRGNNFSFPFLYSVPMLWAKSPTALLVPRSIAEADKLTAVPSPTGK